VITADGQCIVDYGQTGIYSRVEANDILTAGIFIQEHCIDIAEPPFGGRATRIGGLSKQNPILSK
jgi:hypothetical protein